MSHRSSWERYDRRGLSITAIGGLLFTLDIPLLRLADGDQWTMIFARGVLMALTITLAWLAYRWINGTSEPFINGRAGLIVAATNTLANIMFICAVTKTTAANLVFILALNPVFCMLLGAVWLRERLPLAVWGSVALSMAGVAIIGWDGVSTGTYIGDLLALGVALCTAIGLTVVRRSGSNVIPSLAVGSFVSAGIGFFLTRDFPVKAGSGSRSTECSSSPWPRHLSPLDLDIFRRRKSPCSSCSTRSLRRFGSG
jgi:drug/metabolite transporter (DMT)-like permease